MPVVLKTLVFLEPLLIVGSLAFRSALAAPARHFIGPREIALTLMTPIVLAFAPNAYVLFAYLIVAILALSRDRTDLASLYLLFLPMVPVTPVLIKIGGAYLLQADIIVAVGVAALIGLVMHRPSRRYETLAFDAAMAGMILLLTYIGRQDGLAGGVPRAFVATFLSFGAAYLVISRGAGNPSQARRLLLMLYFAGFVSSVVALFETARHWSLYQELAVHLNGFSRVSLAAAMNTRGGLMRAGAAILNTSSFGLFMAVVVSGVFTMRPMFTRTGYWMVVGGVMLGLIAAQSRGAWIGASAGYLLASLCRGLYGRSLMLIAAGLAIVALPSVLPLNSRLAEILGVSGASADTGEYRRQLFAAGVAQVRSHPIAGQPTTNLIANLSGLEQGQGIVDFVNSHLYVAMSAGVPLFVLWLTIWLMPVVAITARRRHIAAGGIQMSVAFWPVAVLGATMVALVFTSIADRSLVWPTLALGLAGPLLANHRRRGAPLSTAKLATGRAAPVVVVLGGGAAQQGNK